MRVSTVVPAFNEEKLIGQSLAAIAEAGRAFTEAGWEHEMVVCDNNSTDRTAEIARQHGAKVVFEPVNQIARARNTGATIATGDWLVFVDADSFPTRAIYEGVARRIRTGKVLGGGCTVRMDVRHFLGDILVGCWNTLSRARRWAAGSFVYCRAEAFREIGGFSTKFYASEEIDFSKRLKVLAKARGMRLEIIHESPLITSGRKLKLYQTRDYVKMILRAARSPKTAWTTAEHCHVWYDGRR